MPPFQEDIEAKLRKQQLESEIDSKWLIQEENNLVRMIKCINFEIKKMK